MAVAALLALAALTALVALMALVALRTLEALAGPLGLGPLVAMAHVPRPGTALAAAAAGPMASFAFWLLGAAEAAQTETALAVSPISAALHPLAGAA